MVNIRKNINVSLKMFCILDEFDKKGSIGCKVIRIRVMHNGSTIRSKSQ